ncbi:MAG: hypothetical protein HZB38_16925 [Planctomycetes bacterium]|nr:hypothetical protein [Planctomycetota bacterium]
MSPNAGRPSPQKIEELLDRLAKPADSRRVADAFEGDPSVAAEIDLQRRIDASLGSRFAIPSAATVLSAVRREANRRVSRESHGRGRLLALAACLVLLAGGSIWMHQLGWSVIPRGWLGGRPTPRPQSQYQGPTVVEAHESLLAAGFKPKLATQDVRAIAATIWRRTGQGLVPKANLPADVRIVGVDVVNCLSPGSPVIFLMVRDKPVSIIVDKLVNDRLICVSAPMEITPFRQEVGSLVLYEVTPHGAPLVRELFEDPQESREWYESGGGF